MPQPWLRSFTVCVCALGGLAPAAPAQEGLCAPDSPPGVRPSADLYCLYLERAPGLGGVRGVVELGQAPSPFGIAVSREGAQVYRARAVLSGLPSPASLGPYRAYVAWLTTPTLFPMVKLAEVRNGTTPLGRVDFNKFIVLITAEASAEVEERRGRLVLRGQSPSSRMQPPDVMQLALGVTTTPADPHASHDAGVRDASGWPIPPMPPNLTMLPAEMALRPSLSPYLPAPDRGSAIPAAKPRQLVRLGDGDTLDLRAGFVRRTLGHRSFVMYGFNEQYPGPLISVLQHTTIVVNFTNGIDRPSTIHWHGVRLDNPFDGVPHVTQELVAPGGTFRYVVHFRDAGIYWYHPHHREDVQQDLGLYGNLMVRSARPDYYSPAHREEILMLDDLLIGDSGLIPYGAEGATHALMGRFGNVYLVNGEPRYELTVQRGEVVRFFLTNVSSTRTFNLSLDSLPLKVVASDVGNFEREAWAESAVIAPAERYVVHVRFDRPGDVALVNRVQAIDHLFGRFFTIVDTLGMVHVTGAAAEPVVSAAFDSLRTDTAVVADIARFRRHFDRPPDKELALTVDGDRLPFFSRQLMMLDSAYFHPVEWAGTMPMMNWAATERQVAWALVDRAAGTSNMAIDWRFAVGDVVKIRLFNERRTLHGMQHPIHLHGQRFLVVAQNGVRNEHLVWKDTVLIPAGGTADILLELSNPGRWMLHCHIAEHIQAGMMMVFSVAP
ncbi:MAG: multicopper oxidase family protein [Gemmatimonadales bacterium]